MSASQNPFVVVRVTERNVAQILGLVLLFFACGLSAAFAQTNPCGCEFSSNSYHAYGANGACGIFMYNNARTCEVSFVGTGPNPEVLESMLGEDALALQFSIAPDIFEQYLRYVRDGELGRFLDSDFIQSSLVVLERGALFRESSAEAGLPLSSIDKQFVEFSSEYSERIAETFRGKAEPFSVARGEDVTFFVGKGYVDLNFQQSAKIRVLYFLNR
tara:strand:- start:2039 stop:2686 length:648 start_codon:yes stop_codon:yes gene_type:complete